MIDDLPPTGMEKGPCPACGELFGGRYQHERHWFCWTCWSALNPLPQPAYEPPPRYPDMTKLIAYLTDVLGEPVATPMMIYDGERMVPARFRTFAWDCPRCLGGDDIYKPFTVTSGGGVYCSSCWGSLEQLTRAVKWRAGVA